MSLQIKLSFKHSHFRIKKHNIQKPSGDLKINTHKRWDVTCFRGHFILILIQEYFETPACHLMFLGHKKFEYRCFNTIYAVFVRLSATPHPIPWQKHPPTPHPFPGQACDLWTLPDPVPRDTVTSAAAAGASLFRTALGRGKRTLATSLSYNNRLIIVFVSNKSEHNRLHVPVLFWAS